MAVVEDTLQTILRLVGAQNYIGQINQVAAAHQKLALAQQQQTRAQALVQAAMAGGRAVAPGTAAAAAGAGPAAMAGGTAAGLGIAIGLAAIAATTMAVKEGVTALAEYDRELIRTETFMKQIGSALPEGELRRFARDLSFAFGLPQTEILQATDYLSRYGVASRDVERDSRILAQASIGTGRSMADLAQAIEMARRGRARELFRELGIPIRGVTDQMYSFDQLLNLVNLHTRDFAQGWGNTLPGATARAAAAFKDLGQELTTLISPAVIVTLNMWANAFRAMALGAAALSEKLGIIPAGSSGALGRALGGGGGGGESATERHLRKIEYNTGPQGPLGRATRGGGAFEEPGGGLRIRDFNQMMRRQT